MLAQAQNNIQQRIDMDLLRRSNVGIFVYLIVFPLALYPFDFYSRFPHISWTITGGIVAVCLLRIIHRFYTRHFYERVPRLWMAIFSCFSLTHGSMLGVFFALVIYDDRLHDITLVAVFMVAGMASGSLSSLSPRLSLAVLYPHVLLMPGVVASFFTSSSYVYSLVMLIYVLYLNVLAVVTNREYMRTFGIEIELQTQKKELEKLSRIDALTGVFNRGYFNMIYDIQWESGLRHNVGMTVLMLDIDHFKCVNDEYGHPAGDACIIQVATFLQELVRRKTDVICRYGGEEFAILLGGTPIHEAEKMAEKIRYRIEQAWVEQGSHRFRVTVSLGVATTLPKSGDQPSLLLDQADQALYRAKRSGRNCVRCF